MKFWDQLFFFSFHDISSQNAYLLRMFLHDLPLLLRIEYIEYIEYRTSQEKGKHDSTIVPFRR